MYVCMFDSTSNAEEFNGQFKMALGFYVVVWNFDRRLLFIVE